MSTVVIQLQSILDFIGRYYLPPLFVIGIIGNSINIIVFSQGKLQNHGCSWYLISASIAQIFVLIFGCFTRIVISSNGIDWTTTSLIFCKIYTYFYITGIILSRHFLCLISIDRWIITLTNVQTLTKNRFHLSRLLILISTIIWISFDFHIFIGFHLEHNSCVGNSQTVYLSFFLIINLFVSLIPMIILIIFMIVILRNIINRRFYGHDTQTVHPITTVNISPRVLSIFAQRQQRRRHKNIQLLRLSLIQIFLYITLNLPSTIYALYVCITKISNKNNNQIVIDELIDLMTTNLLYTYCSITFFLFTLVSTRFRKECYLIYHQIQRKIIAFIH